MNLDFTLNPDTTDQWNDIRIIFKVNEKGELKIKGKWLCTTEPGRAATFSKEAAKLKGVARIAFGYHKEKWIVGTHKSVSHRALKQIAQIPVHRDLNKDFKRTGESKTYDVLGLNQHGTEWGYTGVRVGMYSAGCLVGMNRMEHETFMKIIESDPRFLEHGNKWRISSTVLDGTKLVGFITAHK
jgi:hypothetical protein